MKGNQYSTKSVDVARAKALLVEGNMTPLRSRLKDIFREHIAQTESVTSKETNSGRRKAAIESVVGHGINNLSSSQTATFTLEEPPCYSSDDDDGDMASTSTKPKRTYALYSSLQMAPALDNFWPPKQTIPKSTFRPYNPSYRHIFLNVTRDENPSSSTSSSTSLTSTTTTLHDPVAIMNEALKKKRKISEAEGTGTGTSGQVIRGTGGEAPRPTMKLATQPMLKMMPPRAVAQLPRPSYTFPPRPHTFPPGTLVRAGVLHNAPGQPRPLLAYQVRPPLQVSQQAHGQVIRISPPTATGSGANDPTTDAKPETTTSPTS
jgi:hypothetical protein